MKLDPFSRIMKRIKIKGDCWVWQGCRSLDGYGKMGIGQKVIPVHRIIYMIVNGEIPKGMLVCHSCDNPPCINPDHLWVGTHQDNADDMKSKGRQHGTVNSRKLSDRQIKCVFNSRIPRNALAKKYGVSYQTIRDVQTGATWKSLTANMLRPPAPRPSAVVHAEGARGD